MDKAISTTSNAKVTTTVVVREVDSSSSSSTMSSNNISKDGDESSVKCVNMNTKNVEGQKQQPPLSSSSLLRDTSMTKTGVSTTEEGTPSISKIQKSISASCLLPPKYSPNWNNNTATSHHKNGSTNYRNLLRIRRCWSGSIGGKNNGTTTTTSPTTPLRNESSGTSEPTNSNNDNNNTVMNRGTSFSSSSITIIHKEKLPHYSSERFYLLSELETLGRPTMFLLDLIQQESSSQNDGRTNENSTQETDDESSLLLENNSTSNDDMMIGTTTDDCTNNTNLADNDITTTHVASIQSQEGFIRNESVDDHHNNNNDNDGIRSADVQSHSKDIGPPPQAKLATATSNNISTTTNVIDSNNNSNEDPIPNTAAHVVQPLPPPLQALQEFPPYSILYLLWKPEMMYEDPVEYANVVVQYALNQMETYVNFIPYKPNHNHTNTVGDGNNKNDNIVDSVPCSKQNIHLYLVIERIINTKKKNNRGTSTEDDKSTQIDSVDGISATSSIVDDASLINKTDTAVTFDADNVNGDDDDDDDTIIYHDDEVLLKSLVRYISSHPSWRNKIQGITVGVTNHGRAAPALEAAVQAVTFGSTDRRRYCSTIKNHKEQQQHNNNNNNQFVHHESSNYMAKSNANHPDQVKDTNFHVYMSKSMIGIVTFDVSELLGNDGNVTCTDAVQNIYQSKVIAEWNGNGNIQSYAVRAHTYWRDKVGLPPLEYYNVACNNISNISGNSSGLHTPTKNDKNTNSYGGNSFDLLSSISPSDAAILFKRKIPKRLPKFNPINGRHSTNTGSSSSTNSNSRKKSSSSSSNSSRHRRSDKDKNNNHQEQQKRKDDSILDISVITYIFCYILFHFYHDITKFLTTNILSRQT